MLWTSTLCTLPAFSNLYVHNVPLICHWTMRYEAKNKYFKSLATRLGNFPYSLVMRHQQLQCYYNLNKEVIGSEQEVGPGDTVSAAVLRNLGMNLLDTEIPYRYTLPHTHKHTHTHTCAHSHTHTPVHTHKHTHMYTHRLPPYLTTLTLLSCKHDVFNCCSARWVKVEGVEYRRPCAVIIGLDEEDPVFGCIEAIYVVASQVHFQVSVQTIVQYSSHFHAFVISTPPIQQKLVTPQQLVSPFPLHVRFVSGLTTHGHKTVVLKHSICVLR